MVKLGRFLINLGCVWALGAGMGAWAFQDLSGSAELIGRLNNATENANHEDVPGWESFLVLRGKGSATLGSARLSGTLQTYGILAGDRVNALRFDEGFVSLELPGTWGVSGGVERYADQYSYYWNPTFPAQPKTDLSRPDYLAAGVPMLVVSRRLGRVAPKFVAVRDSGDTYAGIQMDSYWGGTEAYINGFWSARRERTLGVAVRRNLGGWTMHGEGGLVWNNPRTYPAVLGEIPTVERRQHDLTGKFVVGANRSVLGKGLFSLEYYHDDSGLAGAEFDVVRALSDSDSGALQPADALASAYGPGTLRRNYAYAAYYHRQKHDFSWGARSLVCLDDGSGYLQPAVTWLIGDHLEFGTDLFLNFSGGRGEFGLLPLRSSVTVRLKYYM